MQDGNYLRILGQRLKAQRQNDPGLAKERLPLELYYWHRVVMDEVHEFSAQTDRFWTFPLRCLPAFSRWGMTATPPVADLEGVHGLGLLMGVNVGSSDRDLAAAFVQNCLRSSRREQCSYPSPVERFVPVTLASNEMTLYKQRNFDLRVAIGKGEPSALEETLQVL
jgi:hypothetical protein